MYLDIKHTILLKMFTIQISELVTTLSLLLVQEAGNSRT